MKLEDYSIAAGVFSLFFGPETAILLLPGGQFNHHENDVVPVGWW